MTVLDIILIVLLTMLAVGVLCISIRGEFVVHIIHHEIRENLVPEIEAEKIRSEIRLSEKSMQFAEEQAKQKQNIVTDVTSAVQRAMGMETDDGEE